VGLCLWYQAITEESAQTGCINVCLTVMHSNT